MEQAVADEVGLSDEQRRLPRTPRSLQRTKLDYRLAWARTMLKGMGAMENDAPAHWVVTAHGRSVTEDDIRAVANGMLAKLSANQR